ncbi:MAG TPA: sporulation protein [Geobacter sp.]|nr:sporulation protein [Geobacter sp.]
MGGTVKKRTSNAKGILLIAFLVFAVIVGLLVFRKYETATRVAQPPQKSEQAPGTVVVSLFFASQEGEGLVREGRELEVGEQVEETIESVVTELVGGPLGTLAPTLPSNTRVLGVQLKGDVAQVDFGPELVEGLPSGSSAEMAAVYSVVDTVVANFPQVKAVQFLVEGAPIAQLKGHLDLSQPIVADFGLEKQNK